MWEASHAEEASYAEDDTRKHKVQLYRTDEACGEGSTLVANAPDDVTRGLRPCARRLGKPIRSGVLRTRQPLAQATSVGDL
jgi:hypothetical protein